MKLVGILITSASIVKLFIFRPRVLIYTPDKFDSRSGCDFRVRAIYDYLRAHRIPYIEITHTLFGREFLQNIWRRKRMVMYKELFSWSRLAKKNFYPAIDLSQLEEHQRPVVLRLLCQIDAKSIKSTRFIKNFSRLLKLANIKMFISLDDMRHVQEIITACRLNGIKSYGFQHGHITKFHAGWMNYGIPKDCCVSFDKLFVWNDYWKRALLNYSSCYNESNVAVGGELRRPPEIIYKARTDPPTKISDVCLLIPYESYAPKEEIKPFIEQFKKLEARLFFKVRPDVPVRQQLNEYRLSGTEIEVIDKLDSGILSRIDVAIGVYTTFLYEMIFYEKPIFILETSFSLGASLVEDSVAIKLSKNFEPDFLLAEIRNFISKKNIVWPAAPKLRETLQNIIKL